jgi:FAD/FMN-containing dehydrogenase
LVVDMTGFTQLTYNKAAQTAVVGAGWRLGPLYYALWNAGKVTLPAGSCPTVGVAGHALGGGWGFGSRKFGVVSDSILEVQIVSANGTLIIANKNQNSGLLFSMKGAGANSYGKR